MNDFLGRVLHPLKRVELLDLSYWSRVEDLNCLQTLTLTTLILYDVPELHKALDVIVQIKSLE